jgi:hypothetical protein
MAEKLDPKEIVTFEELLLTNTITQNAMINLLDEKCLISKEELLKEIKGVRS